MVSKNTKKDCPIDATVQYIAKRWTLLLIRDMFFGKKRFKEFLDSNPNLSGKVLSDRLKELERNGLVEKKVISTSPLLIEYELTKKGRALNKVLYEIAIFSVHNLKSEITGKQCSVSSKENFKKMLGI